MEGFNSSVKGLTAFTEMCVLYLFLHIAMCEKAGVSNILCS
jgi:hypothetical protein